MLLAIIVVALAFSVLTLIVRVLPVSNVVTLVIAVAAPYTVFVAAVGLALAVLSRRVVLSIAARDHRCGVAGDSGAVVLRRKPPAGSR